MKVGERNRKGKMETAQVCMQPARSEILEHNVKALLGAVKS